MHWTDTAADAVMAVHTSSSAIAERLRDVCSTSNRKLVKKLHLLVSTARLKG